MRNRDASSSKKNHFVISEKISKEVYAHFKEYSPPAHVKDFEELEHRLNHSEITDLEKIKYYLNLSDTILYEYRQNWAYSVILCAIIGTKIEAIFDTNPILRSTFLILRNTFERAKQRMDHLDNNLRRKKTDVLNGTVSAKNDVRESVRATQTSASLFKKFPISKATGMPTDITDLEMASSVFARRSSR